MELTLLEKISERLGGKTVLGRDVHSDIDMAEAINEGFRWQVILNLTRTGFDQKELHVLVIPDRTFRTRRKNDENLSVDESERAARLARIQVLAEETFHDKDKALQWLRMSLWSLNGKTPIEYAATEHGAKVIETILAGIRWGAPA